MDANRVLVFDTTLRDGEQGGHPMDARTKRRIAEALAKCGVDVIEAGFPCSSPAELDSVREIAKYVREPIICALARIKQIDIDPALRAIEGAAKPRIHVFASTSDIHIRMKLRSTREQVLEETGRMVRYARMFVDDVQFSAEDATRTDWSYLAEITKVAIQAGATTINLPDTVGYILPDRMEEMLDFLYERLPELSRVTVSMHCHNDLGLAVANSLAGIFAGARQVEGCFLGIGERAGNVSLEPVIMALRCHEQSLGLKTGIRTNLIGPTTRLISSQIGYSIPVHQPIVGRLAFGHSSGIHRDGVNKARETYEIIDPNDVGWEGTESELTSRMGRNGLQKILDSLGYDGAALIGKIWTPYIALADLKLRLTTEDLHMLAQEILVKEEINRDNLFDLLSIDFRPRWAAVEIRRNGSVVQAEASGDGTVNAVFNAIRLGIEKHGEKLTDLTLSDYNIEKGSGGSEALGWVVARVSCGDRVGFGRSAHPDIVEASAKAFVYAVNHLFQAPVQKLSPETIL